MALPDELSAANIAILVSKSGPDEIGLRRSLSYPPPLSHRWIDPLTLNIRGKKLRDPPK